MDLIKQQITEWLKEILVSGIMNNLSGLFDNVNSQVGQIASQVGTTPQAWNTGIYNMIRNLSENVMMPIAGLILAFVMTLELIQIITDKNNFHDADTASIVQHIFSLCAGGKGPSQIAKQLAEERVYTPGYYYYHKTGVLLTNVNVTRPCQWSQKTVADILEDEVYLGHTISLQSTTVSYKNKKRIQRPKSEQLRFENTHESLVDRETWEIVQDIRRHKRRRANMAEQDMFSGLVYCADCGGTMVLHRAYTMDSVKNNFMCSTYKKQGKEVCSAHYIRESQLAAIVLDDLRRVTHFARQQEALFVQHINQKNSAEAKHEIERLQRELDAMKHRDTELSALFRRLYEDNVLGRITNEQFRVLSAGYNDEQSSLKEKIPQIVEQMEKLQASVTNVSRFVEKAKRYTEIPELTSELLHLFIERIEVGERGERYSRTAEQKIVIRYRDIGVLEAFMEEARRIAV